MLYQQECVIMMLAQSRTTSVRTTVSVIMMLAHNRWDFSIGGNLDSNRRWANFLK
jgi:hypothetical protein